MVKDFLKDFVSMVKWERSNKSEEVHLFSFLLTISNLLMKQ